MNPKSFTIEPHPNSHLDSCKTWMVLRGDNKIHAMSRKISKLRKIKKQMEEYYLTPTR